MATEGWVASAMGDCGGDKRGQCNEIFYEEFTPSARGQLWTARPLSLTNAER